MAEAVAYIEEHLQEEDLSIIATASHVYLNPVYFGRIFKSTFHMTLNSTWSKNVMDKAKRMLEEGDTSIRTICEEVGISNPSYFHNCSNNIPENCQVSIKGIRSMTHKHLSSGIQKKYLNPRLYYFFCTFIINDRSMELYAPYFKKIIL